MSGQGTILDILRLQAEGGPEAKAILAPGRSALSFGQLLEHVEAARDRLNEIGVKRNDRVALVSPNGPEMAAAFLSAASTAACAPLNPAYRREEFEFYMSDLGVRALIVHRELDTPVRDVAGELGVPIVELVPSRNGPAGVFDLECREANGPLDDTPPRPDDTALVLHTSGTTSRPKIVPLSQRNLCVSADSIRSWLGLGEGDRCLNVMPLFHVHGLMAAVLASLSAGGSVVCTPGLKVECFFGWLEEFEPTWYTAVPTMHQAILEQASANRGAIEAAPLRFIRSCSASLPPSVMAGLEQAFGVPVVEAYGMTEASHQISCNPLPPGKRKPGSVGLPSGPEAAVMDDAGKLLGPGEVGEIVIRGANVTEGYGNNPEANESAFVGGWFRTGDEGRIDEDGYIFLTGRIKELINRGGQKISPREIDEVLLEHPAVAQAVAFALPHPKLGEDVAAAVVLKEAADATAQELRSFAFERLAPYKVPSQVVMVSEIPKGPTGKLQRIGLYEKLSHLLAAEYVPPRTGAEKTLAAIWAEVLHVERVGVNDNFFGLGGDSLSASRASARAMSAFGVELPQDAVFREPTIAGQALLITQAQAAAADEETLSKALDEIEALNDEEAERLLENEG